MLLLAYEVPVWRDGLDGSDDGRDPALVRNVREVFKLATGRLNDDENTVPVEPGREAELLERVALAVNVLNAVEAPVREEFLLALGNDAEEVEFVGETLLDELQGPLLFEEGRLTYETHHEYWSMLYLTEHAEEADSPTDTFEACLNAMFEVIDSADVRERIREQLRRDTRLLRDAEEEPQTLADQLVSEVFDIGERRPRLVSLFGATEYSGIYLPAACSPEA
ncbi:MAG: hypothetical protein ABEI99_08065, partial [Halobaculum sp.]